MKTRETKRYEIHVWMHRLREHACFHVVDLQTGRKYGWGKWPQEVLDLMYSDFAAFNAQSEIIEDVDEGKVPAGKFGSWVFNLPPVSDYELQHPRFRAWFGRMPYITLELNELGCVLSKEEEEDDHQRWVAEVSSAP